MFQCSELINYNFTITDPFVKGVLINNYFTIANLLILKSHDLFVNVQLVYWAHDDLFVNKQRTHGPNIQILSSMHDLANIVNPNAKLRSDEK